MLKDNKFIVWGTYCECGNECSILQNENHPWIDTSFTIKMKCNKCGKSLMIDKERAEEFYNNKIYSYYNDLYGKIIDLGCGSGFLSRFLINQNKIEKIYGLDFDTQCKKDLADIDKRKFQFIEADINELDGYFGSGSVDFLVSRDVFMFIEDTDKYFEDVTKFVNKGVRQMGWYMEENTRMKNKLKPEQIAEEYVKRGWKVKLEYLDWYKYGYFIRANK